jgi:hypothetical protein
MDSRFRGYDVIFGGDGVRRGLCPNATTPAEPVQRGCEKDVENRGNELGNSFGVNKNVEKLTQNELVLHARRSN